MRWSGSPWHVFSHVDGGEGADAVHLAWHERGAGASITAGELLRAGCEGRPERLRELMDRKLRSSDPAKVDSMTTAPKDVEVLAPAVDQFLFDVSNAGKIAMPPDVADRYRELRQWIDEALADPYSKYHVDRTSVSMLIVWSVELDEIRRRHQPPRLSQEIRDLMQVRAVRMLRGEDVTPEQDALERAKIAAACEWPLS